MANGPYIHNLAQRINTNVPLVFADMPHMADVQWSAAQAATADDDYCKAVTLLTGVAQKDVAMVKTLPCPRNIVVTGSQSGQNNVVTVYGTNYLDEAISEAFTLNAGSAVVGNYAFKTTTKVDLPAWDNAAAYQQESITFTAACSSNATVTLKVEDTVLTGAAAVTLSLSATTSAHGTVTAVAAAFKALINADETLSAKYTADNIAGKLVITAKAYAANDTATAFTFGASTSGITATGGSENERAGAAQLDSVKIGFGDKLGLPYMMEFGLCHGAWLGGTIESTAAALVTDKNEIHKNTLDLNSSLNGSIVTARLSVESLADS